MLVQKIDICVDFAMSKVELNDVSTGLLALSSDTNAALRHTCIPKLRGFQPAINLDKVYIILRTMSGLVSF